MQYARLFHSDHHARKSHPPVSVYGIHGVNHPTLAETSRRQHSTPRYRVHPTSTIGLPYRYPRTSLNELPPLCPERTHGTCDIRPDCGGGLRVVAGIVVAEGVDGRGCCGYPVGVLERALRGVVLRGLRLRCGMVGVGGVEQTGRRIMQHEAWDVQPVRIPRW